MATSHEYRSSVLRCNIGEDGCAVCDFLKGKRDAATLLAVIDALDDKLGDAEDGFRRLSEAIVFQQVEQGRKHREQGGPDD